jgi:hypothetical protein
MRRTSLPRSRFLSLSSRQQCQRKSKDSNLALVDRQQTLIELQHDQIAGGHVDGPMLPFQLLFGSCSARSFRTVCPGMDPTPRSLAIDDLRIVQVGVVPMSERLNAAIDAMQVLFGIFQHLRNMLAVVIAGVIQCGQRGSSDCGSRAAAIA